MIHVVGDHEVGFCKLFKLTHTKLSTFLRILCRQLLPYFTFLYVLMYDNAHSSQYVCIVT